MIDLKVEIAPEAIGYITIPCFKTEGAAGFDIAAFIPPSTKKVTIHGGDTITLRTGLKFDVPSGYELQIRARSGLAFKENIALVNGVGTIDSDYTGEVMIKLIKFPDLNLYYPSSDYLDIKNGDRIAQGVLVKLPEVRIIRSVVNKKTTRGSNGFGSTGV